MQFPLTMPTTAFVRIRGGKKIREVRAILSPNSPSTLVSIIDAIHLGYNAYYPPMDRSAVPPVTAVTASSLFECMPVKLEEVTLGNLKATNIEALAYDMPPALGVDALIGASFFRNFKVLLDFQKKLFIVEQ